MRLSQNGAIQWHRRYKIAPDTFHYTIYDMKRASDGGFVMVGESRNPATPYNPPTQQGWIIKVDSNGCMSANDPQCWPTAVESVAPKSDVAFVYPNPATSTLNVRYASHSNQAVSLSVTDLAGRRILEAALQRDETVLDVVHLPPGLYLWRITEGGLEKAHGKFVKQ